MALSHDDTIEACLNRFRQTWDEADAHTFAKQFTEDATYVIFLGDALLGRAAIEETHIGVLTKWQKGTRMIVKLISTRWLNDDTASVLTIGGIGTGPTIAYDKFQTFTFVRRDGRWLIASFHNTEMSNRSKPAYNADETLATA